MSDTIGGDRRSDKRYSLQLDVRWKLVRRRKVLETGHGTTIDLSSGGILLETDRSATAYQLPVGLDLELSISWPVMLRNVAPMQLVATGRITRVHGNRVAVRMVQHEFRTVRLSADRHEPLAASSVPPRPFLTRPTV